MGHEQLKGNLDMLLLAVVADEPAHGYSIIARVRERSGGVFDLKEGSVYPALHQLESRGLLRSSWSAADGRRRRVYELTRRGRTALREQVEDWRVYSSAIATVTEGRP
jgi:PadR family transcriptional regulator